jgi:predicted flavoprotein YhiN
MRVTSYDELSTGRALFKDEFITCGGVSLKDIILDSMSSRIVDGIYLCGELLNIDGITGGYNFQAAWSTGFVAGKSCGESLLALPNETEI